MFTRIFTLVMSVFVSPLPAFQANNTNVLSAEIKNQPVIVYEKSNVQEQNQEVLQENTEEVFDESSYNQENDIFKEEPKYEKKSNLSNESDSNNFAINLDEEDPYYSQNVDKVSSQLSENEKQVAESQLASLLSELWM